MLIPISATFRWHFSSQIGGLNQSNFPCLCCSHFCLPSLEKHRPHYKPKAHKKLPQSLSLKIRFKRCFSSPFLPSNHLPYSALYPHTCPFLPQTPSFNNNNKKKTPHQKNPNQQKEKHPQENMHCPTSSVLNFSPSFASLQPSFKAAGTVGPQKGHPNPAHQGQGV